jgi:beta-galactosidase
MKITLTCPKGEERPVPLAAFGGTAPDGTCIQANSRWLQRNGRPWIPVMGEFHFSRYPREDWAEALANIKAGGVTVVATYLFWIHHEEEEGCFRWEDDRDVGRFVRLCAEQGLDVVLRIGPWAHGECRNGGFPDWLLRKPFPSRGNDPAYLALVKRFYEAISSQVRGMMFKDGGPVVGIQLDNEFGHCGGLHGEEGNRHILALKRLALDAGFDVPLWTTTGWGGGIVVDGETLPVLGGYADAPWAQHVEPLPPSGMFTFQPLVPDTDIGTDLMTGHAQAFTYDVGANPYLTAELGGGLQVTHHRRPLVTARDVEAMTLVKLGSGANLLGYYMYHGGTNPVGAFSTLQESRLTGYANDLPEWSYDFQAPLGEYGQARASWNALRVLHLFLADYGDRLAPMPHLFPVENVQDAADLAGMRLSVRGRDGSGFLFVNRHQRGTRMTDMEAVAFVVESVAGDHGMMAAPVVFPAASLRGGQCHIWPFGMELDGIRLESATVQPLCRLAGPDAITHVFFAGEGTGAELRFADGTVLDVAPGARASMRFETADKPVVVLVLTRRDAELARKVCVSGQEHLLIADGVVSQHPDGRLSLTTWNSDSVLTAYPALRAGRFCATTGGTTIADCVVNGVQAVRVRFEPAQGDVGIRSMERVGSRSPALDARKAQWETNAYPPEETCHLSVSLALRLPQVPAVDNWFLELEPQGDAMRLFVNGEVRGDWFYTGKPWVIGLKRFFRDDWTRASQAVRVEIDPLCRTDAVYLERPPAWHGEEACSLQTMRLRPQYRCEWSVR